MQQFQTADELFQPNQLSNLQFVQHLSIRPVEATLLKHLPQDIEWIKSAIEAVSRNGRYGCRSLLLDSPQWGCRTIFQGEGDQNEEPYSLAPVFAGYLPGVR